MSARPSYAALIAAALLAGSCLAAPQLLNGNLPINLDAQSLDHDYRNNLLQFKKVKISQGPLSVEADEATATGLEFQNSRWEFRGKVRITMPDGFLLSDAATIQFKNNTLDTAVITGAPATFEQKRDKGTAKGRAGRIDYDFTSQTIKLSEQAWLAYGDGEITGRTLVYSITDQRVLANPQDQADQRVRITINPKAPGAAKAGP